MKGLYMNNIAKNYDKFNKFPVKTVLSHTRFPLLDIACGTGNFLEQVLKKTKCEPAILYGFDLSSFMIEQAEKKRLGVNLSVGDMLNFHYERQFRTITCLFDSLNHVKDWKTVFSRAYNSLLEGGNFYFDINTIKKLKTFANTYCNEVGNDYVVFTGSYNEEELSGELEMKMFMREKGKKKKYNLEKVYIKEYSHPKKDVIKWLKEVGFDVDIVFDNEYRIVFNCIKK